MFSVICAFIVCYFEIKAEKLDEEKIEDGEPISLKDIKNFPVLYWLILIMIVFSCSSVWTILYYTNKWLNLRFGIDEVVAGEIVSYTFIAEFFLVPIMGWVGDKW